MSFNSEKSHLQRFFNRHSKGSSKKKKVRYPQEHHLSSNDSSESELLDDQQIRQTHLSSRNGTRFSTNRYSAGYLDERIRIEVHESNLDQNDGFHTPQMNRRNQYLQQRKQDATTRSRSMDGRTRMFNNRKVCLCVSV